MNATNDSSQHSRSLLNVLLIAAAILLFLPTWLWLSDAWLSNPYYSHGPLVLVVALYFTWGRRMSIPARAGVQLLHEQGSGLGIVVIAGALVVHLLTIRLHVPVTSTDEDAVMAGADFLRALFPRLITWRRF